MEADMQMTEMSRMWCTHGFARNWNCSL